MILRSCEILLASSQTGHVFNCASSTTIFSHSFPFVRMILFFPLPGKMLKFLLRPRICHVPTSPGRASYFFFIVFCIPLLFFTSECCIVFIFMSLLLDCKYYEGILHVTLFITCRIGSNTLKTFSYRGNELHKMHPCLCSFLCILKV